MHAIIDLVVKPWRASFEPVLVLVVEPSNCRRVLRQVRFYRRNSSSYSSRRRRRSSGLGFCCAFDSWISVRVIFRGLDLRLWYQVQTTMHALVYLLIGGGLVAVLISNVDFCRSLIYFKRIPWSRRTYMKRKRASVRTRWCAPEIQI